MTVYHGWSFRWQDRVLIGRRPDGRQMSVGEVYERPRAGPRFEVLHPTSGRVLARGDAQSLMAARAHAARIVLEQGGTLEVRGRWGGDADVVAQLYRHLEQWRRARELGGLGRPPDLESDVEFEFATCRICGCTDDDCEECIEVQGYPCSWVDDPEGGDLCSRCAAELGLEERAP